jgi:hypothetical protein
VAKKRRSGALALPPSVRELRLPSVGLAEVDLPSAMAAAAPPFCWGKSNTLARFGAAATLEVTTPVVLLARGRALGLKKLRMSMANVEVSLPGGAPVAAVAEGFLLSAG